MKFFLRISRFVRNNAVFGLFVALQTVLATLCLVLPYFADAGVSDGKGLMSVVMYILAVGFANGLFIWLLSLNRWVCALAMPIYAVLGTVLAYYRSALRVTLTPMLLDATLHTNMGTVSGVLSWSLVGCLLLAMAVSLIIVVVRWRWIRPTNTLAQALIVFGMLMAFYFGHERLHRSLNQRYPFNVVHNLSEYWALQKMRHQVREMMPMEVMRQDSMTVVLVIGESLRADHLSLNGYARQTCPRLSRIEHIVSLPHVYSQHTHTMASVPHILTPADSMHIDWAYTQESLVAYYRKAGFRTAWISNQDMGETYAHFIQTCDTIIFPNRGKSVFVFSDWYDQQLLPPFQTLMEQPAGRDLYVLHCIGSHWNYSNHIPDSLVQFLPMTGNKQVTDNTPEQVVNAYDNTVLCFDDVLSHVIETVSASASNALVLYISDHGESLGEDGIWLHAAGAEPTQWPACVVWYSDRFAAEHQPVVEWLTEHKTDTLHTDFVFNFLLNAADIHIVE